ncbi:quinone oxidoreductase family protein [Solicola gregarius]|uniref:Zinc-binding alcohol dehydrogenase family protein n=1 Tax=Solicola gregarius TaxID=2908642 RepID=A0AA46TGY2_9ACTN|nr:zinc-binding alcohol dehydrogenase family protein [Solicola gregarius]UYM05131.1 zinc-binding alcohol dehydrogenase family protein [Solicola gregarius]
MKAAVLEELGQPPRYAEAEEPVPTDGLVVADVRAAAVKNIERALAAGSHYGSGRLPLPCVLGHDAVVALPDGRRVFAGATPPGGAMAERLLVDPEQTLPIPDSVDDASAAALPNAAASAWFALEYAGQIRTGQSVLVLGGTGVTGSLAVQLAKRRFGAGKVVAAGRNVERLGRISELGADATIELGPADEPVAAQLARHHAEHPFDVVLDYLWGKPAEHVLRTLANDDLAAGFHRTRFVQIGEMAGATIELPAATLRSAGIELVGQGGGSVPREAFGRIRSEILPAVFSMLADGTIAADTQVRPLSEVTDVWTTRAPSGVRVVLVPDR